MASFCIFCGAPVSGAFCGQCGKAIAGGAPAQPASYPAPQPYRPVPARAAGGGGAKVILLIAGGVLLLGALGVMSAVYVVSRAKEKITQLKSEYAPTLDSKSSRPVATKPPAGSGCPVLSWQEASEILGIAWERVRYSPGSGNGGACEFTTTPAERERFGERQFSTGLSVVSNSNSSQAEQKEVQGLLAGFVNTLANLQVPAGDKDANDGINIQFVRKGGAQAWTKFDQMQAVAKVVSGNQIGMTPVQGVGDKAYVLPAGVGVVVLKGDAYFGMTFFAWPGQDKAVALAKRVAEHL